MEEAASKPKKKVTFGKAYVRVLLNYNKDNDSEESTEEEMAIRGRKRGDSIEENDSRQSKILDERRPLKDLAQSPKKSEQVTRASQENPNEVQLKSILKKTAETYNETDKRWRSRKSTALAFARWKNFKKPGRTTSSEVEKNQKKTQEMSVVLEQKRLETERRQSVELQKSKNENLNMQGQKLLTKDIKTETSKENVDLKDENNNFKAEETDKPKTTQVKDTGKWPGVKCLDPMKGLVSNTGVYSGVEADWGKTKESLSKFGVEIGEDKLQKPSEFIAIMNVLLGLKHTAVTETNNNIVGAEKKEDVMKPIREETSRTEPPRDTPTLEYESLRTYYLDKVGKTNGTAVESEKPRGTKGQLGERMKNIRKGFNAGEKVNAPKDRKHPGRKRSSSESSLSFVKKCETQEDPLRERCGSVDEMRGNSRREELKNADGKRRQKNAIAELLIRKRSSSENSLGSVRKSETQEDPLRERCGSVDEMRGNSRREDLKNADGKRRQKNAIAELLIRKRSSSVGSSGSARKSVTQEDPLRERCGSLDETRGNSRREDLKNTDGKRRQKNAIAELLVRMKKKKKTKEQVENRNSETEYKIGKQSAEFTQSEEENWVILDTPSKTKTDRAVGRATILEEANQIEDVSHVKETTHDAEISHVRKAIQVEKATQVEEATQVEKATQVEEATQVREANQVQEANQMPDATTETIYVDKACQTKKRSRKKKSSRYKDIEKSTQTTANSVIKIRGMVPVPAQLNPDTLFFKIMSTLPGHEVCVPN